MWTAAVSPPELLGFLVLCFSAFVALFSRTAKIGYTGSNFSCLKGSLLVIYLTHSLGVEFKVKKHFSPRIFKVLLYCIPAPCVVAAAAAAKLLQSCPTLCDPIDGSPPGSPVPGVLQARTLEWGAIAFSCVVARKVYAILISSLYVMCLFLSSFWIFFLSTKF